MRLEWITAYDIVPDPVLVHSGGVWVYANPAALEMLAGGDASALIGRPIFDFVPPEDREMAGARVAALSGSTEMTPRLEQRLLRARGGTIHVDVSGRSVTMKDGSPGVLIVARDVSERRATDRLFRALFEQAPVGMILGTLDGKFIRANRRLCDMIGYSEEELIGRPILDLTHPADAAVEYETILRILNGEIPSFTIEKRHIHKDGRLIWGRITVSLVRDDRGEPDYFLGINEDITERKAAEAELQRRETRFRHMIENGSEMIFVIDEIGTIRYASPSSLAIAGYAPADLEGHQAFAFLHPDDIATAVKMLRKLAAQPGLSDLAAVRIRHANDGWRTFDLAGTNLLDDPSVRGIVINARDVTERDRLRSEVEQLTRVESLGRVSASVAHEMNNVLFAASALTQALDRKSAAAPGIEPIVRGLQSALARGRRVTSEILRFAQPMQLTVTAFAVVPWIEAIANELRPALEPRHHLTLTVDDAPPTISGDVDQLAQVVVNFVLNARDAMPDGGDIAIEVRPSEERAGDVVVAVHDQGVGIDPEVRDRIFDPLFTTKKSGTGLGLPVAQQIVLRHHGGIRVQSEPGVGTTFEVRLPSGQ